MDVLVAGAFRGRRRRAEENLLLVVFYRAEKDSNNIHICDGHKTGNDILHTFDKLHMKPVLMIKVSRSMF